MKESILPLTLHILLYPTTIIVYVWSLLINVTAWTSHHMLPHVKVTLQLCLWHFSMTALSLWLSLCLVCCAELLRAQLSYTDFLNSKSVTRDRGCKLVLARNLHALQLLCIWNNVLCVWPCRIDKIMVNTILNFHLVLRVRADIRPLLVKTHHL